MLGHPLFGHLRPDPLLARAGDRQLQRLLVVRIAVLLAQPIARLLAQRGQDLGVVGQLADALGAQRVVGHLLLDREPRARHLPVAREIAVQLLVFPDLAGAVARHEAGAGVDQRRAPHPLGERDDVFRPLDVGAQGRLERRVERHPPRRVDEHVDVLGHLLGQLGGHPQVRFGDVAVDDHHLVAQERRQRIFAAVLVAQRIERRGRDHALPEPRLAVGAGAAPHHHVSAPDLGVPVQQHAEQHLAHEPGAAEDQHLAVTENLGRRQVRGRRAGPGRAKLHRARFLSR
jgi:hypothetical protein